MNLARKVFYNNQLRNANPMSINSIISLFIIGIKNGDAKYLNDYSKNKKYRSIKNIKELFNVALILSSVYSKDFNELDLLDYDEEVSAINYIFEHKSNLPYILLKVDGINEDNVYDSDYILKRIDHIIINTTNKDKRLIKVYEQEMIDTDYKELVSRFIQIYCEQQMKNRNNNSNFIYEYYSIDDLLNYVESNGYKKVAFLMFKYLLDYEVDLDTPNMDRIISLFTWPKKPFNDEISYSYISKYLEVKNLPKDDIIRDKIVRYTIENRNIELASELFNRANYDEFEEKIPDVNKPTFDKYNSVYKKSLNFKRYIK